MEHIGEPSSRMEAVELGRFDEGVGGGGGFASGRRTHEQVVLSPHDERADVGLIARAARELDDVLDVSPVRLFYN